MKRRYWVILTLIFLVWLDWYIRAPDSRSREMTGVIAAQAGTELKSYPYQFKVLKIAGDTAYLSTPRSFDVPAFKVLAVLYPDLDTKNPNNPAYIAAQENLGRVQAEARTIVLAQPGIKDVKWELDRDWLVKHGIEVPAK
ncbi:hypothetical protein [Dechloromonas denitrificans]|uniref:hypothetical protein n=1 Tax=Dechloromonas denitrificans TaxID=281362 RepID=UPI001CF84B6F|nr:hypothetical protein [Dechloromonas denitrificans]UCV02113.1 hypothetical protein KI611_13515 [Dechloromonas denitrificans]